MLLEPGRLLVGNAGVLLTRVRYLKESGAEEIRDRRCRDERLDPARALPKLSRDRSGAGTGHGTNGNRSMLSARFARAAIFSRKIATCPNMNEGDLLAL